MDNSMPKSETPKNPTPKAKKSWFKRLFLGLLVIFIALQFFQSDKDNNEVFSAQNITTVLPVPDTVMALLKIACYDCHSNNTNYPWYTNIQPVGWWLKHHIEEGKQNLNFDAFAQYEKEKMLDKLKDIKKSQVKGWMPLSSYTWIHKNAILNQAQKKLIIDWADSATAVVSSKK
jgi:hypothetical protein